MDIQIINNIKALAIDMIDEAKSGHPGICLGAAEILYTLYAKHINISIRDSKWVNRDRFILSAGHASALLYATLYMAGYDLKKEDLMNFRKIGKTPGHPEYGKTPGVDCSTGPLGFGFGVGVGMAIASKKLREETMLPKKNILEANKSFVDNKIYVLASDGDLMEGITNEAASIAGNLNLNNLIVLYDSNNVSLDGPTDISFKENVLARFEALGWDTILVKNGNDIKEIDKAISKAKDNNKPTIIEFKTIIGRGSFLEGTNKVHGGMLSEEDITQLKNNLNVPGGKFYVNEQAKIEFQKQIANRTHDKYMEWANNYKLYNDGVLDIKHDNYDFIFGFKELNKLSIEEFRFENDLKEATRVTNHRILKEIAKNIPNFLGGSADLATSTGTYIEGYDYLTSESLKGRNIPFGVREHAMGAILNGLSLFNYNVFGSTFLSFSDYMKPAIRMSSLMKLPVNYIFSHDSVLIGEDGPTHQPVEQLASLRAIPNLNVFRPCDANELVHSWNIMLNSYDTPSALLLSKIEVPNLEETKEAQVNKGGYILKDYDNINGIIIATGTDVHTALAVSYNINRKYNLNLRVVSMPCKELFERQSEEYKNSVLPLGYKRFVIEAGSKMGWEGYVYNDSYLFTINDFGVSAPRSQVLEYMKFDYNTIENGIYNLLK